MSKRGHLWGVWAKEALTLSIDSLVSPNAAETHACFNHGCRWSVVNRAGVRCSARSKPTQRSAVGRHH
jgi:hypothetical protein